MQLHISIRFIFVLAGLLFLPLVSAQAAEAKTKRVALVIGNNRYEAAVGALRNTVRDAKAMTRTLRAIDFTVIEKYNVSRDELLAAMLQFRAKLRGADVGLFYFAGHGISVSGANYLLPVKSGYTPESAGGAGLRLLAETKLFNVEQAVAEMCNAGVGCNLVILDACRSTPVARNPMNRDTTGEGGLVEMNPPAGSLIAFATDAGHAASDGEGVNGLYTEELIAHLSTPGLTIEQVFKRTRAAVMERSGGSQIPAEYSRLVGSDIFLAGLNSEKTAEAATPKGEPVPTFAEMNKLAVTGKATRCIESVLRYARIRGRDSQLVTPLMTLLDHVKEDLLNPKSVSSRVESAIQTCDLILAAVDDCLPSDHSQRSILMARAHSRRGDALFALERKEEALESFNSARDFAPDDAYILYNRGRTFLALNRMDEARLDLIAASDPKVKQPGARRLALKALEDLK